MSGRTTLERLTAALRAHLGAYPLPEPSSVMLDLYRPRITVQVDIDRPGGLDELLAWAYSLQHTTAEWWHTPSENLHITIAGRTRAGVQFMVYGGLDFNRCAGLVPLAMDAKEGVALDELHALAGLLPDLADVYGGAA